ncbi:MAG: TetR/AcrR family transcriptional regulator [bacterium]
MTETPSLRDALIDAGIALLDQGGMPALTLRRAAARAGVSHAAPAHHFDGLPGLLTAIAARAFQIFADTMEAASTAAGPDPFARLVGLCDGYLAFASQHHGLFHVMFVSPEVDRDDPALTPHSARAYLLLRATCLPFAAPDATEDAVLETAVWSMVHGYASLTFNTNQGKRRSYVLAPDFAALLKELFAARRGQ